MIKPKNLLDFLLLNFDIRLIVNKSFQIYVAYVREKVDDPVIRLEQFKDQSIYECFPEEFAKKFQEKLEPIFSNAFSQVGLIEFEYLDEWYAIHYDFVEYPDGFAAGRISLSSVESRTDWLILQRNLALRFSQASDLESIFSYVIRISTQTGYMDAGGIYLLDENDNSLILHYSTGLSDKFVKSVQSYRPDSEQWHLVMAGKPTYLDEDNLPAVIKENLTQEGILSFASIPFLSQGKIIGVLNLASHQQHKITILHKRFFENLVSILGDSINRIQKQQISTKKQYDYLQLLKALPDCIMVIDFEGKILLINQAICERLGYEMDELVGKNISFLYDPDRHQEMLPIINDLIHKKRDHFNNSLVTRNSEIIEVETYCGYGNLDLENVLILSCREIIKQSEFPDVDITDHLEKIIELVPLPSLIIDSATLEILFANMEYYNKFGINDFKSRINSFLQLFDIHEHERLANVIRQHGINGLSQPGSWSLLKQSGAVVDCRFTINQIPWLKKDTYIVNIEIQLYPGLTNNLIQEGRYRDVVDDQMDLICRFTLDGMLTFVNHAYCEFFNLKPEESIGRTVTHHAYLDDLPKIRKNLRGISIENPVRYSQNRMVDGKGRIRWVNWADRGIFIGDQLVEIQGVGRDITEDVDSKISSEAIEKRYQSLIEEMPVVVYVIHAATQHPIYISPQILVLSGYSVDEIYQTNDILLNIIHPDDVTIVFNGFTKRIKGEKNLALRYRIRHKDGHSVLVQDLGAVIEAEDGTRLLQGMVMDVSTWNLTEGKLLILDQFEGLFNDIRKKLAIATIDDWPANVNYILRVIGKLIEADRSYVFEVNEKHQSMSNTFEWCADGIEPQIENLKDLPLSDFQFWINSLSEKEMVSFSSLDQIPENEKLLRETLEVQEIKSILAVPVKKNGKLSGYLGFDSVKKEVKWSEQAVFLLRMIADILQKHQERLNSAN